LDSLAILDTGYGHGLRMVDTGPSYGVGVGERRLGAWLASRDAPDMVVSTKVGSNLVDQIRVVRSFDVQDMRRSFDDSLLRLGRSQVDILYLHGPAVHDLNEQTCRFLEEEKRRGRILWAGVNSFQRQVLEHCVELPIDVVMLQYNVLDQSARFVIPELNRRGKVVISGTPFARATYSPETFWPLNRVKIWYLLRALKDDPLFILKVARIRAQARSNNMSPFEFAVKFVLGNQDIDSVLFGTSSPLHMRQNMRLIKEFREAGV